jgi:hypothetical protein
MPITQFVHDTLSTNVLCGVFTLAAVLLSPNAAQAEGWDLLDAVLAQYVQPAQRAGIRFHGVDYEALAMDSRYGQLLAQIETTEPATLTNREERLAFYINAYNVYAIKMVIDNMPMDSIRDAGSLFTSVWKKTAGNIAGEPVTLDQIEHAILRTMGEPRIHFAIVCASLSCPNLRQEAYRAEKLEQQLEDQTRTFLNNDTKGLTVSGSRVRLSQIFDWFEEDFDAAGGVEAFVREYRELPQPISWRANLPYDWDLNRQ